jgi:hypothetical protein
VDRPGPLPEANRCNGHDTIESLIQKTKAVSLRVFESDYLCLKPQGPGIWFTCFEENSHVTMAAEYDPNRLIHLSIDPGVQG